MPRKGLPANELEATRLAAALMYCDDRSQDEIKKVLNLSQSAVSRLLKATEKVFWCKRIEPMPEGIQRVPADIRSKAEAIASGIQLIPREVALALGAGKTANHLLSVRVFSSVGSGINETDWDSRSTLFAQNAVAYIRSILTRGRIWGVTWGGQLDRLAAALEAQGFGPTREREDLIMTVPLCGEPFGTSPTRESSSALAERIALVMNGPMAPLSSNGTSQQFPLEHPSLSMVPAFIPRRDEKDDIFRTAVWDLIDVSKSYRKIFGSQGSKPGLKRMVSTDGAPPLAERLDGVLTSVSLKDRPYGYRLSRMFASAGLKDSEITKTFIGDIGGVGLSRPGKEVAAEQINQRWTGLQRDHLFKCAERAALTKGSKEASPGVIVLCVSSQRYECVKQAIQEGLVSHLVCDLEIGAKLKDLF